MADQAVVADTSSAPVMDISRGPLVDLTPEQRTEFRATGNLPTPPKTEDTASSDTEKEPNTEAKAKEPEAGDTESQTKKPQETAEKKSYRNLTAEQRIKQMADDKKRLQEEIQALKSKPTDEPKPKTEPANPEQSTKPKIDDKKDDGTPKYAEYEDYIEALSEWKTEERLAKVESERAQQEQANEFNSRVEKARTRYENFDTIVEPAAGAILNDAAIAPAIKQMLSESEVLPDFMFTVGSDPEELGKFITMARQTPGKALRYIALTESLIADELAGKSEPAKVEVESPAKPRTQAPKPPSEAGGRAAAPPDALEAAAKAGDFRSFKAEATRRQLAKLKG